ncbi:hypothetical protein HMPREF9440_00141 [Sutterella parvirubra YIT 11816]|uniref:Uncharacterized protein n=1 Tax=Sutterella parvirubra YIT 11816 TaxID=762967 RepID=H3KBP5_9BURK|nr:hypothetical protein HMPREF9440_00141 [Sutterella parvirubra YIT 11816]
MGGALFGRRLRECLRFLFGFSSLRGILPRGGLAGQNRRSGRHRETPRQERPPEDFFAAAGW